MSLSYAPFLQVKVANHAAWGFSWLNSLTFVFARHDEDEKKKNYLF